MIDQAIMSTYLPKKSDTQKKPTIYVDSREASNRNGKRIINLLNDLNIEAVVVKLDFGDYLLGENIAIERKTVFDLANTLTQRFLFEQIFKMKEAYPKSMVLIEGYMGLLRKFSRISPESMSGALFALTQVNIPLVPTIDYKDTAIFLATSAKQLLKKGSAVTIIRHKKKTENLKEQQLFAVTGLPHIGPTLGENLLRQFKTVRAVFHAKKQELIEVKGIGSQITKDILRVLDTPCDNP
ncbi:MAG: ERCC4 domain-containing protein [Candidatus Bathyarchaeota archaeon]